MDLRRLQLDTSWGTLRVAGGSRAGDGTIIVLPQLSLALDGGRAHHALPPMSTVVISHGHSDHIGGIAYWASQRHLQSMGPGVVVAPREIASDIEQLLTTHARLEGGAPYDVRVVGVDEDNAFPLRRDIDLAFFRTDHWVPTFGSRLVWRRHRLLPELIGLRGEEIKRRRQAGEIVATEISTDLLSYCADSGPLLLDGHPEVLSAEVLMIECSFYRPADRDRARRFGHTHLDDLLAWVDRLNCRHLVILHASRRHRLREIEEILEQTLRPRLSCSLHHLVIDWD